MICIYDQGKMAFDDEKGEFSCPSCKSKLKITQNPELTHITKLSLDNSGIDAEWIRGEK